MATQGVRQEFLWRPNTTDSTNLARYSQEAQLWTNAFRDAQRKHRPSSIRADLNVIGLFVQLSFSLATLVVLSVIEVIKWIRQ